MRVLAALLIPLAFGCAVEVDGSEHGWADIAMDDSSDEQAIIWTETADEAAYITLDTFNEQSIESNREYHWLVFRHPETQLYASTAPVRGDANGDVKVKLSYPKGMMVVAMGHTHGAYAREWRGRIVVASESTDEFDSDDFSSVDYAYMNRNPLDFEAYYLGTPSGAFQRWSPEDGKSELLAPESGTEPEPEPEQEPEPEPEPEPGPLV